MKRTLNLILILTLLSTFGFAQPYHRCATHDLVLAKSAIDPAYGEAVNEAYNYALEHAKKPQYRSSQSEWDTIYRIPVVVHVLYKNAAEELSDQQVMDQIAVLNEDFRRLNADTTATRDIFKPVAQDAGIEFFLAETDPQGDPTTGIIKKATTTPVFIDFSNILMPDLDLIKSEATGGSDPWDTDEYLNLWVGDLIEPGGLGEVYGFATPAAGSPNWPAGTPFGTPTTDGVVIHYEVFGGRNLASAPAGINQGRTAVHEVGHYLGLRHTWGDGTLAILGIPDCTVDDGIDDTPNTGLAAQLSCDLTLNTCDDGIGDLPDQIENYMDYAREVCSNMFSAGQVGVMRSVLATIRTDLPEIAIPVSIVTSDLSHEVDFYPNPVLDVLHFKFASKHDFDKLSILNMAGEQILTSDLTKNSIDLSSLSAGLYLIKLEGINSVATKKIVVKR